MSRRSRKSHWASRNWRPASSKFRNLRSSANRPRALVRVDGNRRVPAAQALRILAKKSCQKELKWVAQTAALANVHYGGTIHAMSPANAGGTTINERVGNKITIKKVIIRWTIQSTFATLEFYSVRLIIGWFAGSAAPTTVEILSDTGTAYSTKSFYTSGQIGNFHIYSDKIYTLRATGPTQINSYTAVNVNHVANYAAAAAALPKNKNLFFMLVGNTATGVECPQITFRSKVTYTE